MAKPCIFTHPAQTKFRDDTPTPPRLSAAVLHSSGARVPLECVQLKLGMMADLGRQSFVAGDEEVRPARNFVGAEAVACFDIANDADVGHGVERW